MKITKTDKPDITLFAICDGSVMLNDGTACMIYRGQIDLYLHHINSNIWYRITHTIKHKKVDTTKNKNKDSKNPF